MNIRRITVFTGSAVVASALVITGAVYLGGQVSSAGAASATNTHVAAPKVVVQANHLTGRVLPHGKDAKAVVKVTPFSDGCDHAYGVNGQCIPLRAAGNKPITCAYLEAEGYLRNGLVIHQDHLHLLKLGQHRVTSAGTILTSC